MGCFSQWESLDGSIVTKLDRQKYTDIPFAGAMSQETGPVFLDASRYLGVIILVIQEGHGQSRRQTAVS